MTEKDINSSKGHPGNSYGTKLKDSDIRQEAFRQYCEHLASGYPKQAFFFEHPTHSVCWKTMDRYIKESPTEFPAIKMEQAIAKRYKHWLDEGQNLMKGAYKCGSPVVWQTCMRNIFKDFAWDREEREGVAHEADYSNSFDALMNLFQSLQRSRKMDTNNGST